MIESNVLRVSIPHNISFEESDIFPLCGYEEKTPTDSLKLACLNQFYDITINDSFCPAVRSTEVMSSNEI